MQDFAAIDFETANNEPTSVCSVGIVTVRGGVISNKYYSLIKPEPNYYLYHNIQVHGLTKRDTDDARVFPSVWQEVVPLIEGLPLVAHNKAFDELYLRSVMKCYQMDYPDYEFHCTLSAARRFFKGTMRPANFQLQTIAALCGYDLTQHHNALADAEACAAIAIKIL